MNETVNVTSINPHWRPRPEIQTIYQFFEGYKERASDEALARFIEDNKSLPIGADVKVSIPCESFYMTLVGKLDNGDYRAIVRNSLFMVDEPGLDFDYGDEVALKPEQILHWELENKAHYIGNITKVKRIEF